jgi:hypothetical protein
MSYIKFTQRSENQYFYPNPPGGGSKLIFFTPANWRVGVNEENKFAVHKKKPVIHPKKQLVQYQIFKHKSETDNFEN